MRRLAIICFVVVFGFTLMTQAAFRHVPVGTQAGGFDPPPAPNPWSNTPGPAATSSAPIAAPHPQLTVLTRDGTGQFHLDGEVNGQQTRFLVDTGADVVALTLDDATRLGLPVDPAAFQPILRTASGTASGEPIHLDRLSVGGTELHDVDAMVVQGLGTNLLGQSALRRLGKVELQGDEMRIIPG